MTTHGGDGNDSAMNGGNGDDTLHVNAEATEIFQWTSAARGTLLCFPMRQTLTADQPDINHAQRNDHLILQTENYQSITGTDGDDTINASAWTGGGISIFGLAGVDVLRGGSGNDYIDAGQDDDSLYGNGGHDDLRGGLGNDTLEGGDGDDYVDWYDYYVNGYAYENGADQLLGGAGDDWIYSTQVDTFQGGADYDRTNLNLVSNVLISDTSITLGVATFSHETEEWYYIYGTENADTIDASAWTGPGIAIYGYGGDDVLKGGAGNDLLLGYQGNDTIEGNDGHDDLRGGEDSDTLDGGAGNDYLDWYEYYATVPDVLRGGAGDDYLYANSFDDFSGGEDHDGIALNEINVLILTDTTVNVGGAMFNHEAEIWHSIYGTENADTLDASAWTGPGITINGLGGDDTIYGIAGNDSLDGGQGSDTVYGNGGDDYVYGGLGIDLVYGGEGNDWLNYNYWSLGGDYGVGDTLEGQDGDDRIWCNLATRLREARETIRGTSRVTTRISPSIWCLLIQR